MNVAEPLGVLNEKKVWDMRRWEMGPKEGKTNNQREENRLKQSQRPSHKGAQERQTEHHGREGLREAAERKGPGGSREAKGRDYRHEVPPSPHLSLTSVQPQCSAADREKPLLPQPGEFDIQSMKINSPKVRGLSHP